MADTASPLEIVYSLIMFLTFGITLINVLWSQDQLDDLLRSGQNGPIEVLRRGSRDDQVKLSIMAFCSTLIGVNALFTMPNPDVSVHTWIGGAALIVMSVMLSALSISMRLRPGKVYRAGGIHSDGHK